MATTCIIKYRNLIRKLFPTGKAWNNKSVSSAVLYKLIQSLASEPCRIEARVDDLLKEVDPNTTFELLEDWERLLGLPDECDHNADEMTLQERRQRVIQVLTTRGGQNEAFYKQLASNFGFDIDVIEVQDQPPFRAGISRAGDKLTNGDWRYAFIVKVPSSSLIKFRASLSRAGDPLQVVTNQTIECLLNKYKPAHSIVLFSFE